MPLQQAEPLNPPHDNFGRCKSTNLFSISQIFLQMISNGGCITEIASANLVNSAMDGDGHRRYFFDNFNPSGIGLKNVSS